MGFKCTFCGHTSISPTDFLGQSMCPICGEMVDLTDGAYDFQDEYYEDGYDETFPDEDDNYPY